MILYKKPELLITLTAVCILLLCTTLPACKASNQLISQKNNYPSFFKIGHRGTRGLMPVNNTFTQFKNHYNKDEHIAAVNDGLKRIAADEHITLIDLHPHFLDSEGRLKKEYTLDGLHPNAAGYEVWKKVLLPYLK